MKRSERGHVYTEIYILVAGLGIATAILVPKWQQTRVDAGIHQCALALDAAVAANTTGTCPIDPIHFEFVHKDDGSLCCANPGVHQLAELCAKPGEPPAAVTHPEPSKLRRIGWGVAAAIPGGLLAVVMLLVFIGNVISFVRSPKEWWASLNRRGF